MKAVEVPQEVKDKAARKWELALKHLPKTPRGLLHWWDEYCGSCCAYCRHYDNYDECPVQKVCNGIYNKLNDMANPYDGSTPAPVEKCRKLAEHILRCVRAGMYVQ
jgi:hypothetical protein